MPTLTVPTLGKAAAGAPRTRNATLEPTGTHKHRSLHQAPHSGHPKGNGRREQLGRAHERGGPREAAFTPPGMVPSVRLSPSSSFCPPCARWRRAAPVRAAVGARREAVRSNSRQVAAGRGHRCVAAPLWETSSKGPVRCSPRSFFSPWTGAERRVPAGSWSRSAGPGCPRAAAGSGGPQLSQRVLRRLGDSLTFVFNFNKFRIPFYL